MKKLLLTTMIASMLILPFGTVALADHQEAPACAPQPDYITGCVPAESSMVQALAPTVHAIVLAMNNQDVGHYTPEDLSISWEALYNLLSMYGQMDERSEYVDNMLVLPAETVSDFSCALMGTGVSPEDIPESLMDRMTYDSDTDRYILVCGSDSLSQVQFKDSGEADIYGSLIYLVDGSPLSSFRVSAQQADNLLGYRILELELA